VLLYRLDGWGHYWPDDGTPTGFAAAAEIWDFFARHVRADAASGPPLLRPRVSP
jgi:poly(3-hydroxybutyrate) depolymerase